MHRCFLLLAGLSSWACAHRTDQVFVAPGRLVTGSSGAQTGYGIKVVRAKQDPTELVGDWTVAPDTIAALARVGA